MLGGFRQSVTEDCGAVPSLCFICINLAGFSLHICICAVNLVQVQCSTGISAFCQYLVFFYFFPVKADNLQIQSVISLM